MNNWYKCLQVLAQQETDRTRDRPGMRNSPHKSPHKSPSSKQGKDSERKKALTMRLATTSSHVLTYVRYCIHVYVH